MAFLFLLNYFRIAVLKHVTSALRLNFFYSNCQRLPYQYSKIVRTLGSPTDTVYFLIVKVLFCKYVHIKWITLYIWFNKLNILVFFFFYMSFLLIYVAEKEVLWQFIRLFFGIMSRLENDVNTINVRNLLVICIYIGA